MSAFSQLLSRNADYVSMRGNISSGAFPLGVVGLPNVAKACFIAAAAADTGRNALVLTQDEPTAVRLTSDLNTLGVKALFYPTRDRNFREDASVSREYERARLGVLGRMVESGEHRAESGDNGSQNSFAVVASVEAAAQFTMPAAFLKNYTVTLKRGAEAGYDRTIAALAAAGYSRADMVEGEGQFAVRGSIVDFFPPDSPGPVRAEFFGDEVDTLNYFDPVTQRRGDDIGFIKITPAREIIIEDAAALADKIGAFCRTLRSRSAQAVKESLLRDADALETGVPIASSERYLSLVYDERSTLFDYIPDALLFVCDSGKVRESAADRGRAFADDVKMLIRDGALCKGLDKYSLSWEEIAELYTVFDTVYLDNLTRGGFDTAVKNLISCDAQQMPVWSGSVNLLREDISPDLSRGAAAVLFAGTARSAQAIAEDLRQSGEQRAESGDDYKGINVFGNAQFVSSIDQIQIDSGDSPDGNTKSPLSELRSPLRIVPGTLSSGVRFPRAGLVIAAFGAYVPNEGGVFTGERSRVASRARAKRSGFRSTDDLRIGDYVVHDKHGIGVFAGIRSVSVHGVVQDYIKIQYRGTDVLYVPVNQLDHIAKYIAPGDDTGNRPVRLSRLGSSDWSKTKTRVKQSVRDIAKELIALYAKRQNTPGYAFSPDIDMQRDFELRFPYDETLDQIRCIDEIKGDMERPVPMDRLLCGDVGFGKTEVALRAAFKCVADGKQVAILVPTTILALQHYRTVLSRFEGFPIETEMLSRFRSPKERADIIKRLAEGNIDIVIGTHALLGKQVKFRDIGLIIVDEEQRFGVAQKEKLKANFPFVDVLTLSATPIPRTLNMSMVGIRDMSVIEDPPQDRLPVQTCVMKYDPDVIAEAIATELRRGGQVYYLYNRISDIDEKAHRISEMVPGARIGVGHGRMSEDELSEVWRRLVDREIDILVCTTIIETGVDVPNANTLIIEDADRMGLAQLHQLRGRVGRSSRRAYAYFTFRFDAVSDTAESRLTAIRDYTEFGSGFRIAMKDLEIRGAGSILGARQHGHLEAVGYDMYLEILQDAVEEEKTGEVTAEVKEKPECTLDIRSDAHIPEEYIGSLPQRLAAYRRIAAIDSYDAAADVVSELRDRYGKVPDSVRGLIAAVHIRNAAIRHGIYEIRQDDEGLKMYGRNTDPSVISVLDRTFPKRLRLIMGAKEGIFLALGPGEKPLDVLTKAMKALGT